MTLTETIAFVTTDCCVCGVLFAFTTTYNAEKLRTHDTFYCPNGHGQSFVGKTDAEKERERADRLERQLANEQEYARALHAARETEKRAHAATKGQLTKARTRANNGVCQYCRRSFASTRMAQHVAHMHPEASA